MGRIWTNHWLERHKSFETMMERYAGVECEHLRAKVPCRSLFQQVMNSHNWQGLQGDAERLKILEDLKASLNSSTP
eukprot:1141842-Pelagomonas_calceolata.AAC.2